MFARPGITALRDQAVSDFLISTGLPTLLRRSPYRALAYAQAGLANGQYGYLDWIARQSVPWTATGLFLEAWGALVGVFRLPATAATGVATFTNTSPTAVIVPAGTVLRRSDGFSFATGADLAVQPNATAPIGITATVGGTAATLYDNTPLALASAIYGIQSVATGSHGVAGTDPELDAPFRTRVMLRWAQPPQGGAASDYLQWASAVPGVTRAWVNPNGAGAGTVVIYAMRDVANAASSGFLTGTNGVATAETRDTPATGDQAAIANYVYPLRPVTALVYVVSPLPFAVPFAIHTNGLVPPATQVLVAAAIDSTFLTFGSPLGGELEASVFETAIAAVPGMPPFTLTLAPIQAPLGSLPVRGVVTYA